MYFGAMVALLGAVWEGEGQVTIEVQSEIENNSNTHCFSAFCGNGRNSLPIRLAVLEKIVLRCFIKSQFCF